LIRPQSAADTRPVSQCSWAHFTEGRDDLVKAFTAAGLADVL
jgi:hypothetical protein